ncbi:MAG: ATP-dependent helicase RecG [Bacteroidales bacterium]|nr:ATP-dependent helicase RecG [Bacteroidales bacterium]
MNTQLIKDRKSIGVFFNELYLTDERGSCPAFETDKATYVLVTLPIHKGFGVDDQVSDQVSDQDKASYIKQRGFKDDHYKKMIIEFLNKYGKASKADIDKLLLDILPGVLDEKQKSNKIRNIVYSMSKKDKTIENKGTTRYPQWVLSLSKTAYK